MVHASLDFEFHASFTHLACFMRVLKNLVFMRVSKPKFHASFQKILVSCEFWFFDSIRVLICILRVLYFLTPASFASHLAPASFESHLQPASLVIIW